MLGRTGPCSWNLSSGTDLQSQSQPEEEDEAEEDEGEELGHTETYADYVPSKCECAAHCQPPAGPCQACTAPVGSSRRQGQWPELRAGSWDSLQPGFGCGLALGAFL